VWDVATRALAADATLVEQPPWVAAFSPDQALIITGAENGTVRAWEKHSLGALRRTPGTTGEAETLALSPDGLKAAVSGGSDGGIQLNRLVGASIEPLAKLAGHQARAAGLAFTTDGKHLVSGGIDGAVKLWDLEDLSREARALDGSPDDNIVSVSCSPDGRGIAYSTRRGGINLVDLATGKNRTVAEPAATPVPEVLRVSFNAAGTSLGATRRVKWLEFYDPVSGALQWKGITDAPVWSLQFLSGTDLFAVGTWDSGIEVWSESKRARVGKLSGHTRVVSALAWKPADEENEGMLASASSDGTLKLWSVSAGTCLATLRPEAGAVTGVAFVPGQSILLSTHADGSVGRWDLTYYNRHIEAAGRVHGREGHGLKRP
jgi:WD40 repeat protein